MRLDEWMIKNRLLPSRSKAIRFIRQHGVFVNGKPIMKASFRVKQNDTIILDEKSLEKFSKPLGYHKLEWILSKSKLSFNQLDHCLDIGASAGGFSLFMLERVKSVLAIEISPKFEPFLQKIQENWSNFSYRIENFFDMKPEDFPHQFNVITADMTLDPIFLINNMHKFEFLIHSTSANPARLLFTLKTGVNNHLKSIFSLFEQEVFKIFCNPLFHWIGSFPGKKEKFIIIFVTNVT